MMSAPTASKGFPETYASAAWTLAACARRLAVGHKATAIIVIYERRLASQGLKSILAHTGVHLNCSSWLYVVEEWRESARRRARRVRGRAKHVQTRLWRKYSFAACLASLTTTTISGDHMSPVPLLSRCVAIDGNTLRLLTPKPAQDRRSSARDLHWRACILSSRAQSTDGPSS